MEAETYNLQVGTVYSITLLFFFWGGGGGVMLLIASSWVLIKMVFI